MTQRLDKVKTDKVRGPNSKINIVVRTKLGVYRYVYINMYIIRWFYVMMRCHEDTVMLCSTMDPYGRFVIEVAYGEMIFSLHRGCMGDDSSRKVVGVSAWYIAHVWHTSVGSVYIFFIFKDIKTFMYYVFKSIYTIK